MTGRPWSRFGTYDPSPISPLTVAWNGHLHSVYYNGSQAIQRGQFCDDHHTAEELLCSTQILQRYSTKPLWCVISMVRCVLQKCKQDLLMQGKNFQEWNIIKISLRSPYIWVPQALVSTGRAPIPGLLHSSRSRCECQALTRSNHTSTEV